MDRYFAPCPRGLEALLAAELGSRGAREAREVPGGVAFQGDREVCYAANLRSRLASRVLWRIADFAYASEADIYEAARSLDWPALFAVDRTLRVYVTAQKSPLKSLEFITLRIKDAVCDRFRDTVGSRPSVEKSRPEVRVHAFLVAGRATLYLDTSGEPLFKRGWRRASVEAPLRENLAAGIVQLTRWVPQEPLLDPMCGGGTILAEAAGIALGVAPGAGRSFGFEKLHSFDARLWQRLKSAAGERRSRPKPALFGSDADSRALEAARRNLANAGFGEAVRLERADVLQRAAPAPAGVLVQGDDLAQAERRGLEEAAERRPEHDGHL